MSNIITALNDKMHAPLYYAYHHLSEAFANFAGRSGLSPRISTIRTSSSRTSADQSPSPHSFVTVAADPEASREGDVHGRAARGAGQRSSRC